MKTETVAIPKFLDMELLGRLPSLEIQARYLVHGFWMGMHRSPLQGFNVEFKEYRSYQQGDEPRTIDWKVYARTGKLEVKVREEDTNLTAYVLIDASGSMSYRSASAAMSKWNFARSLAAGMILLLSRQRDAASLGVFGAGPMQFIRPSLKASEHRRMMAALEREPDGHGAPLAKVLDDLVILARRRSLIFVLSDFYENLDALETPIRQLRHAGSELIFLQVMDPRELHFDFTEPVLLQESETRDRMTLSPDLMRKRYLQRLEAHLATVAKAVQSYGGDYQLLRTDVAPFRAFGAYLACRRGAL